MFKPNTVFVVGAGASSELGFPFGQSFKDALTEKIDIRRGSYHLNSGDPVIAEALNLHAQNHTASFSINPYLNAARNIRDALTFAPSIDSFIDMHEDDENIKLVSKLAILKTILDAERSSKLYHRPHERENFSFPSLSDTWLAKFVQILIQGAKKDRLDEVFDNISIICFNYDRSIENFLSLALQQVFALSEIDAQKIALTLNIYHPYGLVGDVPWVEGEHNQTTFGKEIYGTELLRNVDRIKTFSEQIEEENEVEEIKNIVQNAERLVFLGMAFHQQNIDLIRPSGETRAQKIFGTAMGFSKSDRLILEDSIGSLAKRGLVVRPSFEGITCSKLFDDHRLALSVN